MSGNLRVPQALYCSVGKEDLEHAWFRGHGLRKTCLGDFYKAHKHPFAIGEFVDTALGKAHRLCEAILCVVLPICEKAKKHFFLGCAVDGVPDRPYRRAVSSVFRLGYFLCFFGNKIDTFPLQGMVYSDDKLVVQGKVVLSCI